MVTAEAGNEYVQLAAEPGSEPGLSWPLLPLPYMTDETAVFLTLPTHTHIFQTESWVLQRLTNESQLMRRKEGKIQNWEVRLDFKHSPDPSLLSCSLLLGSGMCLETCLW